VSHAAFGRSRPRDAGERTPHGTEAVSLASTTRLLALATLGIAQALDFATFQLMVARHGLGAEANPIVQGMYQSFGTSGVAAAKVALVVLIASLFIANWGRGRRGIWAASGGLPIALAIAAGIIGGITNASSILG
jgi:hypothetical protein